MKQNEQMLSGEATKFDQIWTQTQDRDSNLRHAKPAR